MKILSTTLMTTLLACIAPAQAAPQRTDALSASGTPGVDHLDRARGIEGLWDEQVTIKDCNSGATLLVSRGTNLFLRGGGLVATNTAPPTTMGPTLGQWWHESHGDNFGAKMRLNRFNADGSFAGIREIEREITLDNDANELTGSVHAIDYDPAGNPIHALCASEAGTRVTSP